MSEVKELLIKAKAKIDTPEKWTQGWFARDENSLRVNEWEDKACKFCSVGAIHAVAGGRGRYGDYTEDAVLLLPKWYGSTPQWNDAEERTHAEVMQAFDEAIERA